MTPIPPIRIPLSSSASDAVLVVSADSSRLLLADAITSAPLSFSKASLSLSGTESLQASFTADNSPGVGSSPLVLKSGNYAGSLVVEAPDRTELFSVSGLTVAAPEATAEFSLGTLLLVPIALVVALGLFGIGAVFGYWKRGAAVLVMAGLLYASGVSAHGGEDHGDAPKKAVAAGAALVLPMESQFLLGLRTIRAQLQEFQPRILAPGSLVAAPGGSASIRAPRAGRLQAPPNGFPSPGSMVQAGQLLTLLQENVSSLDKAALASARTEAATRQAEAARTLALASRDLQQLQTLGSTLSERQVLERQQAYEAAQIAHQQATLSVHALKTTNTLQIVSPFSGQLLWLSARPGDQVAEGEALFKVLSPNNLWVEVRVPESDSYALQPGSTALLSLPSLPQQQFSAIVLDHGLEADPETGTVRLTLALQEAGNLKLGLSAYVWLATGSPEPALLVPDSAVVESNGIFLVFVKIGPEQFEAREVALGSRDSQYAQIHSGLQAGERVVVAGTYALKSIAGR
jgi:cobalt-zinc-cadmium efflux system membrane fusion protein